MIILTLLVAATSALLSMSSLTNSFCPNKAANMRGVFPSYKKKTG